MAPRTIFTCDAECPNVTRTHQTKGAMQTCKSKREQGGKKRASSLAPQSKKDVSEEIPVIAGRNYSGTVVRDDLADSALWRPDFAGATLSLSVDQIEGAYLPGADFRHIASDDFVEGVPMYMMTEARGAVVDQHLVDDALFGDRAWLLTAPDENPETREGRIAAEFVVPFLQWSFSDDQWERYLNLGYDPEELVEAAQEFPPRNEAGFEHFMDSGDVAESETAHPHWQAWGERELTLPPMSNVRAAREGNRRARI